MVKCGPLLTDKSHFLILRQFVKDLPKHQNIGVAGVVTPVIQGVLDTEKELLKIFNETTVLNQNLPQMYGKRA